MEADNIMAQLEELNRLADAQNKLLTSMLEDIQKDWTDDEKLMINDPKAYYAKQKTTEIKPMAKQLSNEALECLQNCSVNGNVVKLPDGQLERSVYVEVKNRLELIGGKWKTGKIGGFVFEEDPTMLLADISNGDRRDLKKEFQFFASPAALAARIVFLADIKNHHSVLEPSAGDGAIIKEVSKVSDVCVDYFEIMPLNRTKLKGISNAISVGEDFLAADLSEIGQYDRIVANPPFTKNQDITHIYQMFKFCKKGGRIVTVASNHWRNSGNKAEKEFAQWISDHDVEIEEIEAGTFKESGTTISACLLIINK